MTNPFESIPSAAEEEKQIQQIADITVELLTKRYAARECLRGVHPKSHGCVRASFTVNDNLPEKLKVGLFARPGEHKAMIRFSNATGIVTPDLESGSNLSRGMAVKVMDAGGECLFRDQDGNNQDFLMINTPAFAFANIPDYLRLSQILLEHNDVPDMFFAPLQVDIPGVTPEMKARIFRSFQVVQQIKSTVVANPLEVSYFSAAPFLFGPKRVMRYSAVPEGGDKPQTLPGRTGQNYLAEALAATLSGNDPVTFDFRVQVREAGEAGLGIEDATTEWPDTPYVDVAKIVISAPQRRVHGPAQLALAEKLTFSPWHALPEHQPLGSINRLRGAVYRASVKRRLAAGGGQGPVQRGGGGRRGR